MALNGPTLDDEDVSSPSARIHDLNSIDTEVSRALHSASRALKSLTAVEQHHQEIDPKEDFETNTNAFLHSVQAIGARLRRQAYALEEAGIIAAEASNESQPSQQLAVPGAPPPMQVTNGGLGNLDVGWLNSRRDNVGRQKEAELWAQARVLLEQQEQQTRMVKEEVTDPAVDDQDMG